jgi:hypothetical protein
MHSPFRFLGSNQLSGTIPHFVLPSLQLLWLDNNLLTGTIPNFNSGSLYQLYVVHSIAL